MTHWIARVVASVAFVLGSAPLLQAQTPDGAALYKRTCAQCHETGANRAPNREAFLSMPAERVMSAMETGSRLWALGSADSQSVLVCPPSASTIEP